MRCLSLFALLTLGLPAFAADEVYDLRGPAPVKGLTVLRTTKMKIVDADVTVSVMGQKIELKQNLDIVNEDEDEVLEVKGRDIVKMKSKIVKDTVNTVSDINGNEMKEDKTGELQGETVLTEKGKDGKWKHTLLDGKPTDEQKKDLDKRDGPENDDDIFPEEKVKVGHTWTVDAAKIKSLTGSSFTDVTGKMKQKFVKLESVDGEECAVIETTGTFKGKMKDDNGTPDVEMTVTAKGWRNLKTGIEVKGKMTGNIKVEGTIKMGDNEIEMKLVGQVEGTSSAKIKK